MDTPVPTPQRKRLRAKGFDYATHGAYLVTICVDRMQHRFGQVADGEMVLNQAGELIDILWSRIPERFVAVELDAWIVMPNHLHGIVSIHQDAVEPAPTLSRVIQAFKSESTVEYGRGVRAGRFPAYDRALWQRGFHDRIIRDDRMLDTERSYLAGNPGRWHQARNGQRALAGRFD